MKKQYLYTDLKTINLSTKNPTGSVAEDTSTLHIANSLQIRLNTKDIETQYLYCSPPSSLGVTPKLDEISVIRWLRLINHLYLFGLPIKTSSTKPPPKRLVKNLLGESIFFADRLPQIADSPPCPENWAFTSICGGES